MREGYVRNPVNKMHGKRNQYAACQRRMRVAEGYPFHLVGGPLEIVHPPVKVKVSYDKCKREIDQCDVYKGFMLSHVSSCIVARAL